MSFHAHVLKVLIASPKDTLPYRDAIEAALHGWNGDRAEGANVVLLPRRWEFHAVPVLSGDGQSVINAQLVDDADIIFGVFHAELGSRTARAASGTAEELDRGLKAGKSVHLYFSDEPLPRNHDREQLAALDEFKNEIGRKGLYGSFQSEPDLKEKVRSAIEFDLRKMALPAVGTGSAAVGGPSPPEQQRHARLSAHFKSTREQYLDSRGKIKYRTHGQRLVIVNDGEVKAERVRVSIVPVGEGEPPEIIDGTTRPDIPPGGQFSFILAIAMSTALNSTVIISWYEGDVERSETHTVSFT